MSTEHVTKAPQGRYETGTTPARITPSKRKVTLPTVVPGGVGTITLEEYRRQQEADQ